MIPVAVSSLNFNFLTVFMSNNHVAGNQINHLWSISETKSTYTRVSNHNNVNYKFRTLNFFPGVSIYYEPPIFGVGKIFFKVTENCPNSLIGSYSLATFWPLFSEFPTPLYNYSGECTEGRARRDFIKFCSIYNLIRGMWAWRG